MAGPSSKQKKNRRKKDQRLFFLNTKKTRWLNGLRAIKFCTTTKILTKIPQYTGTVVCEKYFGRFSSGHRHPEMTERALWIIV